MKHNSRRLRVGTGLAVAAPAALAKIALAAVLVLALLTVAACSRSGEAGAIKDLTDGTYWGTTDFSDGNGWAPFLRLTVADGRIQEAVFDNVNTAGEFKSRDGAYNQRMSAASGSSPAEYTSLLPQRLLESGKLPVEAVSGATSSSRWFNELAATIVERAATGDNRIVLLPMSATYRGEDQPDGEGWIARIAVSYQGQTISHVDYDEIQREGATVTAGKRDDTAYAERWNAATGLDQRTVYPRLIEQLEAEGLPSGVDIISGATATSRRFRIVAQAAMGTRVAVDFIRLQTLE